MRTIYLDCGMGAAGDMLMGALLQLHPEPEAFLARLNEALPASVRVSAQAAESCGVQGCRVHVLVDGREEGQEPPHRHEHSHIQDIYRLLESLEAPEKVRQDALAVYQSIARAESKVHGRDVEHIHLHELGSLDALADVLGVSWLFYELDPEQVLASPVQTGSGSVRCAHGLMPVPAPATALLLQDVPMFSGSIQGELCTPTGAALLKYYVNQFGAMPVLRARAVAYGMGSKDFGTLNAVRALLGETEESGQILELSCNLDDMTPEALGFAQEELLRCGALDVYTTGVGMKKNRPGVMLTCMCREEQREEMLRCLFRHTTTLGVREYRCARYTLTREEETRHTPAGPLRVKRATGWGVSREKAEYEDLARIAREREISLAEAAALAEK